MKNRSRLIAPEFWESESVGDLTFRQRLLFLALITNADDQGRLKYRAALIRAEAFPYDDIALDDIRDDLDAISGIGGIEVYTDNTEKGYIQIIKWWKFQHPSYAQPSRFPAPEGWKDGWNYKTSSNKLDSHNWPKLALETRGYTDGYTVGYTPPNTPPNTVPDTVANTVGYTGDKVTESKVTESKVKMKGAEPAPNPNKHPAIQAYREAAHLYPVSSWKQKVIDAVGTNTEDVSFWRHVCDAYVGLGWNPKNVKVMLEFFGRKEIPSAQRKARASPQRDAEKKKIKADLAAAMAIVTERLTAKGDGDADG